MLRQFSLLKMCFVERWIRLLAYNCNSRRKAQSGQIVVEYVLLLIIGVTIAFFISTTMVSRSESSPGFLIQKWSALISIIGADDANDVDPN